MATPTQVTAERMRVGGAVSLSALIAQLMSHQTPTFQSLAKHLLKIANVPVRNVGSWAGNLMLTRNHDNFPSDVFTVMAAAGATLAVGEWAVLSWQR